MSEIRINKQLLREVLADLTLLHAWSACDGPGGDCCSFGRRQSRVASLIMRTEYSDKPARRGEMRIDRHGKSVIWTGSDWEPVKSMEGG